MNFFLIAIVMYFISKKQNFNLNELLDSIPINDIVPLLSLLGINEQTLNLINEALPALSGENIDFSALIKTFLPLITSFASNSTQSTSNLSEEGVTPLSDIAPQEILNGINDYFA